MARRRKRGSLRSPQGLRKLLKQMSKDDLIKLAMQSGLKGKKPRRVRKPGKGRRSHKPGSYARTGARDRLGHLLPRGSKRVKRRTTKRRTAKRVSPPRTRRAKRVSRNYLSPAAAAARIRAKSGTAPKVAPTVVVVTTPKTMTSSQYKALQFKHNLSKSRARRVHA
jgi:hypothetical protein